MRRDRESRSPSVVGRRVAGRSVALAALLLVVPAAGCRSPAQPAPPPPAPTSAANDPAFSAERAWKHLEALTAIGPRPAGSEGAARARAYLREELENLGLQVEEQRNTVEAAEDGSQPELEFVNLTATIPGASPDVILLVAAYDTPRIDSFEFVGANEAAAGPAVVLELARALSLRELPYTVQLAFLDGEHLAGARGRDLHHGSRALAMALDQTGQLDRIRLAFFFERVGDADLRLSRDLNSSRIYRETVWRVAGRLGAADAFPPDAEFEAPDGPHRAFLAHGMRRVVVLEDDRYGGDEPPGTYARTEQDTLEHVSAESLGVVGSVALASIEQIGAHLAKIDRFAKYPLDEPAAEPAQPEAPPAEGAATEATEAVGEGADAAAASPEAASRPAPAPPSPEGDASDAPDPPPSHAAPDL